MNMIHNDKGSSKHQTEGIDFSDPRHAASQIQRILSTTVKAELVSQMYPYIPRFSDGGYYIQYPPEAVEQFLDSVRLLLRATPGWNVLQEGFEVNRWSLEIPARLRRRTPRNEALGELVRQAQCIDANGRMWGSRELAQNPPQAPEFNEVANDRREELYQEKGWFSWHDNPFS